jgi:hypothetical protein
MRKFSTENLAQKWKATFCDFRYSAQLNIFHVCNLLCQNYKLYVIDLIIVTDDPGSNPD